MIWTRRNNGNGAMMSSPRLSIEEVSGQAIKILTTSDKVDLLNEGTTRITTIFGITTTEETHHTSQTKTNPGIGEVKVTFHNRLQRHDKIPPSRILADNPDQFRLLPQCLTGLEIETRATIYPTTRNSQLPTMVTSQT